MSAPDRALSDIDALPASQALRAAAVAARIRQQSIHTRMALLALGGPLLVVGAAIAWEPAARAAMIFAVGFYMAWTLRLGRVEDGPAAEAARWREALDCEAFDLTWNRAVAGTRPSPPEGGASAPTTERPPAEARPFPIQADAVPLPFGRLLCQMAALDWDGEAARRYRTTLGTIAGVLAILLLAGTVLRHPGEESILVTVFALSPIAWWLLHVHRGHQRAGALAARIAERVESAWRTMLAGTLQPPAMAGLARGIQNDLFAFRVARPALLPPLAKRYWPVVPPGERRLDGLLADYRNARPDGS